MNSVLSKLVLHNIYIYIYIYLGMLKIVFNYHLNIIYQMKIVHFKNIIITIVYLSIICV